MMAQIGSRCEGLDNEEMADAAPPPVLVPGGEARACQVTAGTQIRIVDVAGGQVGDLFAFVSSDIGEYASAEHTRPSIGRLFPAVGQPVLTTRRRPILTLMADTSPGHHDSLYAACDPARYRLLGVEEAHRSCAVNLAEAMAAAGFPRVAVPQPLNLFMDVRVTADGSLLSRPASSAAGDAVVFRAELDCHVVLSSCPMDVNPISSGGITPLRIELTGR